MMRRLSAVALVTLIVIVVDAGGGRGHGRRHRGGWESGLPIHEDNNGVESRRRGGGGHDPHSRKKASGELEQKVLLKI